MNVLFQLLPLLALLVLAAVLIRRGGRAKSDRNRHGVGGGPGDGGMD